MRVLHRWTSKVKRPNGRHKGLKSCAKCGIAVLETVPSSVVIGDKALDRGPRYTIWTNDDILYVEHLPPCKEPA